VAQGCCELVLQSSTEQQGSYFALTSVAVHLCCITAHLYEEQTSINAIAVAQGCCEPVLQSSTEQQGSCFALTSVAINGVASLHTCMKSKSPQVQLQWHKAAVSLFCRAALNSREAVLP